MAAARFAFVAGIVAGDAEKGVVAGHDFDRSAARPHVLVIILAPRRQIGAKAAAAETREGAAHADGAIAQRHRGADHAIGLVIAAIGAAQLEFSRIAHALGDIFYRAADGIAAVERALRPAQHLDALDVVNVEHRRLRAVEHDIVKVEANPRFEPGNRILLPDAADKGRKRIVGAARHFERHVRGAGGDIGDIDGARVGQRLAGYRRNCDRNVDQPLVAAAGRDDDDVVVGRGARACVLRKGGGSESEHRKRARRENGAAQVGGE